jgi:hypothetical protein
MNYPDIILTLGNSLLNHFDEVYHSAELIVNDKKVMMAAVPNGEEWTSLMPSDQKETVYIRRNGNDEVMQDLRTGGCSKFYLMQTPLRIVLFKDFEKDPGRIIARLMQSILITNVKLIRIIRDKWKLLKEESSGIYDFGPSTLYFAIEVFVLWELSPNRCAEDLCLEYPNPLKKGSWPAVA